MPNQTTQARSSQRRRQQSSEWMFPIIFMALATAMMLWRPPRGEVRVIDALLMILSGDRLWAAVKLQAIIVGCLSYVVIRLIGRAVGAISGVVVWGSVSQPIWFYTWCGARQ